MSCGNLLYQMKAQDKWFFHAIPSIPDTVQHSKPFLGQQNAQEFS